MKDPVAAKLMAEIADLDAEAARVALQRAERTRALAAALAGGGLPEAPEVPEPTEPPAAPPPSPPPPPPKTPERRRRLPMRERPRDSREVSPIGAKRAAQRLRKHGIT